MSTSNSRDALAVGNIPAWIVAMEPDNFEMITCTLPDGSVLTAYVATVGTTGIGYNPGSGLTAVHVHESPEHAVECFHAKVRGLRATVGMAALLSGGPVPNTTDVPDYVPDGW